MLLSSLDLNLLLDLMRVGSCAKHVQHQRESGDVYGCDLAGKCSHVLMLRVKEGGAFCGSCDVLAICTA